MLDIDNVLFAVKIYRIGSVYQTQAEAAVRGLTNLGELVLSRVA